jgi:ketosteroid isomerase-like protein
MTVSDKLKLAVTTILLAVSGTALAQDSADDEADVILTIEEQWEAEQDGDNDWLDEKLVEAFSAWPTEAPAPRSKSSTRLWSRFADTQGQMIEHELYFQNIVVHGDVAVAHYFYTSAYQDKDDNVDVTNGRYTDVLVRTEDGWKFLAWHGGDDN